MDAQLRHAPDADVLIIGAGPVGLYGASTSGTTPSTTSNRPAPRLDPRFAVSLARPAGGTSISGVPETHMRMSLSSTSTRTFVIWPLVVGVEQALSRRRVRGSGLPLMAAGYAAYRLAGAYRLPRSGGPPGMSQGMPERLVEDGPYRWTRNPMYGGHLVFLTGLALSSGSPVAAGLLGWHLRWFADRVRQDEKRLREQFGPAYDDYCARTPRWIPRPPTGDRHGRPEGGPVRDDRPPAPRPGTCGEEA